MHEKVFEVSPTHPMHIEPDQNPILSDKKGTFKKILQRQGEASTL